MCQGWPAFRRRCRYWRTPLNYNSFGFFFFFSYFYSLFAPPCNVRECFAPRGLPSETAGGGVAPPRPSGPPGTKTLIFRKRRTYNAILLCITYFPGFRGTQTSSEWCSPDPKFASFNKNVNVMGFRARASRSISAADVIFYVHEFSYGRKTAVQCVGFSCVFFSFFVCSE